MNAARWSQVRAAFDELVELAPAECARRLAELRDVDAALADEAERLLAADSARDTARFAAVTAQAACLVAEPRPRQVGPWRLLRLLGAGGMGEVHLGERQTPSFTQQAAIKLLRVGWNSLEARRRFESEQRVLATLQHPNIAHLIDGGIAADGQPYLALEYVDGRPLDAYAAAAGLSARARVRLFLKVCDAVEHAHQRLVVHRDLKPGNILVDAAGVPKLLDFGIAKLLGEDQGPQLTSTGVRLYTPGYAAPEQLRGEPISTATDVYALGVVLYELLAGGLPFQAPGLSALDWERAVLTQEPQAPSRISRRGGDAIAIPPGWAGDIDAIVLKAIRREPELRHPSVAALRADLEDLLDGRPVSARRGSRAYRWRKLLRRHALALGLGSLSALALLAGSGISLWQASVAREARARADARAAEARESARRAEATVRFLTDVFAAASPGTEVGPEPTARDLLRAGEARIAADEALDPSSRASLEQAIAYAHMGLDDLDAAGRMFEAALASARRAQDLKAETHALLSLAILSNRRGNTREALARFEEADRLLHARANRDPLLQAYVDRLIAMEYINADRPGEALERIASAHAAASAELDPLAPEVTGTLSVYMAALHATGRKAEGLRYTTPSHAALATATGVPPAQQISVLASHSMALSMAGRLDEALAVAEETLQRSIALYGADDHRVMTHHWRIGSLLRERGDYRRSAEVFEVALRIAEGELPEGHFSRLGPMANAGRSWLLAGDPERARPLIEGALAGYRARGEYDGAAAARVRWTLVQLLLREGREAQARTELSALDLGKLDADARAEAEAAQARLAGTAKET